MSRSPWVATVCAVMIAVSVPFVPHWWSVVAVVALALGAIADAWSVHFLRRLVDALKEERDLRVLPCESCGQPASWKLADGSYWCTACHASALNLGYDTDGGTPIVDYGRPS